MGLGRPHVSKLSVALERRFDKLNANVPSLSTYGMGVWLLWSFSSYRLGVWGDPAVALGTLRQLVYFCSTTGLMVAELACFFLQPLRHVLNRPTVLLWLGVLSFAAALYLGFCAPEGLAALVVWCGASVITGLVSGAFVYRVALMLGAMGSAQSLACVIRNSLLTLILSLVLFNLPGEGVAVLQALSFPVAAFLFALDASASKPVDTHEGQTGLPQGFWRIVFAALAIFAVLAFEVSGIPRAMVQPGSNVDRVDANITLGALLILCAAAFQRCCSGRPVDLVGMVGPTVIATLALIAATLIIVPDGTVAAIFTGSVRFLLQNLSFAFCIRVAQGSRTSAVTVMLATQLPVNLGDIIGRAAALGVPVFFSDFSQRSLVLAGLFAVLLGVLASVLSPDTLRSIAGSEVPEESAGSVRGASCAEEVQPGDAAESKRPATTRRWKDRCRAVASACGLTDREAEVLVLLTHGVSSTKISEDLGLSYYTVRSHTRSIYAKAGVHSKQELIELVESAVVVGDGGR